MADGWAALIFGGAIGVTGVVLGTRWQGERDAIVEKLDPLKDAVGDLHALIEQSGDMWRELKDKYTTELIDWDDVHREEDELKALEQDIIAQVEIIEGMIYG